MASDLFAISAFASKELQAVIVGMKGFDRPLAKFIRAQTKRVVGPAWVEAVQKRARSPLETATLGRTATVQVRDENVVLIAGGKGKLLRQAPTLAKAAEFGAQRDFVGTATSTRGKKYRRKTQRQLPRFNRKGNVVYPAAANVIPRIAALWVQTSVRALHATFEGKPND